MSKEAANWKGPAEAALGEKGMFTTYEEKGKKKNVGVGGKLREKAGREKV